MTWAWTLLRAGRFRLDGGSMFGVVPKPVWSRLVEPDARNRIPLQTNCLLIDDGIRKILVETGYGGKWSEKECDIFALEPRTVVDALREAGVDPDEIAMVVVTHLHFDHAGGLTHAGADGTPVPSFPNAAVVVQRTEWNDARANKSTMTRTYLDENLAPIADHLRLADGTTEIMPGLTVWPMPGHTWGQQAVRFATADGMVCFPGDVMPTANHAGLAFSMGYDMEPYRTLQSKRALLQQATREQWRIVLDHEPDTPVVTVSEDSTRPGQYVLRMGSDRD